MTPTDLRAYLLAGRPASRGAMTAAVAAFAAEYGCSESAVWRWLAGNRPLPGWVRHLIATRAPASTPR